MLLSDFAPILPVADRRQHRVRDHNGCVAISDKFVDGFEICHDRLFRIYVDTLLRGVPSSTVSSGMLPLLTRQDTALLVNSEDEVRFDTAQPLMPDCSAVLHMRAHALA